MPWYWTDDVANFMIANGRMSVSDAAGLIQRPVGIRSTCQTIEDAVQELLEDGEIPLAA